MGTDSNPVSDNRSLIELLSLGQLLLISMLKKKKTGIATQIYVPTKYNIVMKQQVYVRKHFSAIIIPTMKSIFLSLI